jgi:ethanolamine transporter EutH
VLALRTAFTAAVMAGVVWLLLAGRFAEALFAVVVAVWLRRSAEAGSLRAFRERL